MFKKQIKFEDFVNETALQQGSERILKDQGVFRTHNLYVPVLVGGAAAEPDITHMTHKRHRQEETDAINKVVAALQLFPFRETALQQGTEGILEDQGVFGRHGQEETDANP
ncbi:MAG: hypothetical protein LBQ83_03685 [Candidatus Margulisbacteria bacterium]|jgi:hypothetical protein|nr:hypothetical protein [Candidatus Margulisiibacteriota bacterium]